MGVYLSSPITTKESSDQTYGKFTFGVSSMQGWRMAQEDAHNCIPDFDPDTNTSLFAVYDGHGGAEVAKYCAQNLPSFIKGLELFKEGKLEESLEEAFLGFDETLTKEEVIQELKEIAGVDDDEEEEEDDEPGGRTETDMLVAEANMPIEELMAKYSAAGPPTTPQIKRLQKDKNSSPMLRGKKDNLSDKAKDSDVNSSVATVLEDKLENGQPDNDNNLNVEKELREAKSTDACESSDIQVKTDKSDSNADNTNNNNKSANTNGVKTDPDQKDVENSSEGNSSKKTVDADSTTDENHVVKSEIVSSSSSGEVSTTSSDSGVQMSLSSTSSSSSSAAAADTAGSSSADSGPSGSGCSSSSSGEPSGSGVQAGGSGVSAGSSGASGSGSGSKGEKTIVEEDFDSDDDSSEEEEYMEESDDDDDDEEDEEDEEEGSGGFAGVFGGRGLASGEEEDHNEEPGSDSGCTAVLALLRDKQLVVANAGDSRCILCREGKAVDLSFDHKPEDESEKRRIEEAGGKVTSDGRVNGGLNLSRALGDHWYKRNETKAAKDQMISALPDIEEATLTDKDEFMVIACDGIWNFMSSQEVVDFVQMRLNDPVKRKKPSIICEELFDHCLAPNTMGDGTGCDNMTCIIVLFNHSETSNKRDSTDLDTSKSDDKQPEKRAKLDDDASTDNVTAT